ncbi:MAG: hypothetical protein HY874_12110 [Chloroflexi bacterium]|nr:hypothetical protein [Chloroflexota bacterium]
MLAVTVFATSAAALVFARATGRFLIATVAGAAVVFYLHGAIYLNFTSDDAYVSYRYAAHLGDGLGLVWNPGQRVDGYSSFLWILILAAARAIGGDLVVWGRWLGLAAAAAAAGVAFLLAEALVERKRAAQYAGLAAALTAAAAGPFALWSHAGGETPLFALLVATAAILHIREQRAQVLPISGIAWALVLLTRNDGIVLFAVSACFKASALMMATDGNRENRAPSQTTARTLALWGGMFAAIYVPYFAWRYATYGWPVSNTYYARVDGGLGQYELGLRYLVDFAQQYAAWLALLAAPALLLRRSAAVYVLAMLAAWALYVVATGGDEEQRFRRFAEVLPLLYAIGAASIAVLLMSLRIDGERAVVLRAGAAALLGAGLLAFTLQSTPNQPYAITVGIERQNERDRVEIGRWLREHAPPDASIAVLAAGAIPYESRLASIDMRGTNDERIAHGPGAGHERADPAYVLGLRPDAIILFDTLLPAAAPRPEYDRLLFAPTLAAREMVKDPGLWRDYEPRGARIGDGWFSVLVRRDSPLLAETEAVPQ